MRSFVVVWLLAILSSSSLQPTTGLAWFAGNTRKNSIVVPDNNVCLLILPGFGNDASDYYLPQAPQGSLVESLHKRGWKTSQDARAEPPQIYVLPVKRTDWLLVFLYGIFDWKFWTANCEPTRPAFRWYLDRLINCINEITSEDATTVVNGDAKIPKKVVLVAHSAGGWLARAALGYQEELLANNPNVHSSHNDLLDRVLGLVCLGTPNLPPPPTVMDMTRGALRITNERFPGAYYSSALTPAKDDPTATESKNDLFYITVVGDAIRGVPQERNSPLEPTTPSGFAYTSYEAVCGDGTTVGDGVVPLCAAHLDGALQLTLQGIFHSINAPDKWYGSDAVIDSWHSVMLQEIDRALSARSPPRKSTKTPSWFPVNNKT